MNLLERLAAEHLQLARPRVVLVTPSYDTSRYVVGLVFDGSRLTAVLKTCRSPVTTVACDARRRTWPACSSSAPATTHPGRWRCLLSGTALGCWRAPCQDARSDPSGYEPTATCWSAPAPPSSSGSR